MVKQQAAPWVPTGSAQVQGVRWHENQASISVRGGVVRNWLHAYDRSCNAFLNVCVIHLFEKLVSADRAGLFIMWMM